MGLQNELEVFRSLGLLTLREEIRMTSFGLLDKLGSNLSRRAVLIEREDLVVGSGEHHEERRTEAQEGRVEGSAC